MTSQQAETRSVALRGTALLSNPLLNKDTAFTLAERDAFGLHGLLPTHIESIEQQADRVRSQLADEATDLDRHVLLRGLQDYNETLFIRVLQDDLPGLMPIVYTPVVGEGCQKFSKIYRHNRGLFISYPDVDRIEEMLRSIPHEQVDVIVATDGERILGLGDQGADGLGIPIGKLSLYSVCGGIDPAQTLPIVLDVGTNNEERRNHPDYLGWRHERVVGPDYDAFIEAFITAVAKVYPQALFQFEDFAEHHAHLLLDRYRDRLCTFNDDIQGTATVALAAVLAGLRQGGQDLVDQRVAIVGAGSAGTGIAEQVVAAMIADGLSEAEARSRFYLVDRVGLLTDDMDGLLGFQQPLAQALDATAGWTLTNPGEITLVDVMRNAHPTVLIGVTGVPGLFTEEAIRAMAEGAERPLILPLSNPTSRAEGRPEDMLAWTDGRALVGTGSPFGPVTFDGTTHTIAQTNNAYIFPGLGLGVLASGATRVTDEMFMAAAHALAKAVDVGQPGGSILPPLTEIRELSRQIAIAVGAAAQASGVAPATTPAELETAVTDRMWAPTYPTYVPASQGVSG